MIFTSFLYVFTPFYISNNPRVGLDERIIIHRGKIKGDNITSEIMLKIYETTENLQFLQSSNTSMDEKLYFSGNRNVPKVFTIFNGGLMDDWNFDF